MRKFVFVAILILILYPIKNIYGEIKTLYLHIDEPGQNALNITISPPLFLGANDTQSPEAKQIVEHFYRVLKNNLNFLPFLRSISIDEVIGGAQVKGVTFNSIDFKRFVLSKVDILITIGWDLLKNGNIKIEVRAFDVYSPFMMVGRGYVLNGIDQVYDAANKFCSLFMKKLTGKDGFFTSKIAFVKKDGNNTKNIYISTPQGYGLTKITELDGIIMSPSWSYDGNFIIFTYISNRKHKLLIWSRDGKLREILVPGNTIISPTFHPNGNIVLSSDINGNLDIYSLDNNFKIKEKLVQSWAIDISPDFDNTGKKMVYVSSIYANPNIFLYDFEKKITKRISYIGNYNTNPDISGNGKYVIYSTLTEKGHRIVICSLDTLEEKIITNGPGNDENPTWGPDDYFIAFTSNRSGQYKIYITSKEGTPPVLVNTGDGEIGSIAWSKKFE